MRALKRSGFTSIALEIKRIVGTTVMVGCLATAYAYAEVPPEGDPSAFTDVVIGLPEGLPEANAGSFEGGITGTAHDADAGNTVPADSQREDGTFNVPTNSAPSPMYGAQPFTQQMLRFEEFGTEALNLNKKKPENGWTAMPAPADAQSAPDGAALEAFLGQGIWPVPTKFSNTVDTNPWETSIEAYLGRALVDPPAEGRPPGLGWSHQRWDDFTPSYYFQTAMAGARVNGGFRDANQGHAYSKGEFGNKGFTTTR